ncbi:MAG: hypothetical protein ACE5I7_10790 [Candidatus Binatia bacterium]
MAQRLASSTTRPRISIDVEPSLRRRVRLAAAKRDLSVREYVLAAIEARLESDLGQDEEWLLVLTAEADPVLAELWHNERDAAYDHL